MTDHTGENITIHVAGGLSDQRALAEALARVLDAGRSRSRQSRWQRFCAWMRRCVRG